MEIMSPALLWKDFDRRFTPLDVTFLYSRVIDDYLVTALYFSALKTDDGLVRAFARLYAPISNRDASSISSSSACLDSVRSSFGLVNQYNPLDAPIIIYFNDITKRIEDRSTLREALSDYAMLCIDYAGRADDRERHTIYPHSLSHLNYFDNNAAPYQITTDIKKSSRYVWAVLARRAITLIEEHFPTRNRIGIVGVGLGGCPVVKACSCDSELAAGMTIYSAGYIDEGTTKPVEYTAFKAALDIESYGSFVTAPVLTEIASNERDGSMDYMNSVFAAMTNPDCRYSIVERTNRSIAVKQRKNCKYWFDYHINKVGSIQKSPTLKATCSDGKLYLETEVDRSSPINSIELFVSQGMENPAYRNWAGHKMEMISESVYLTKVPVLDAKTPVYAFVNVKYDKGMSLSSLALRILPEKLGVRCEEAKPTRLIYDSDMELDDWTVLNDSGIDEDIKLTMEAGPFEIMGVSSTTGSLSTFKISERVYKSFADSALQLLIYSTQPQDVVFTVAIMEEDETAKIKPEEDANIKSSYGSAKSFASFSKIKLTEYSCQRKVSPADNWTSITLSATDFKSSAGTLESFEDISMIEIRAKDKFLISSLLWV